MGLFRNFADVCADGVLPRLRLRRSKVCGVSSYSCTQFHRLLPASQLTILPGGVAHYTFLDTCSAADKVTLPVYCADAAGVDRDQVHAKVSGMAIEFFDNNLC